MWSCAFKWTCTLQVVEDDDSAGGLTDLHTQMDELTTSLASAENQVPLQPRRALCQPACNAPIGCAASHKE